jgi:CubicO group peptidase (beta-lactamase class C family)
MKFRKRILIPALIIMINSVLSSELSGQSTDKLPRSIPELQGVSSSGIIDFLNAIDTGRQEIHSFMFLRHGKVIAEGWWNPYGPEYKHLLYSASKTFTATAVGLAVSEKKLTLADKVTSFFPYSLPDTIGDYMKELNVRDLLTMSVGQEPAPMGAGSNQDWIRSFIINEPVHKPGTVFLYNNMATFMLSAIVQQVTGQTVFDYLMPRIFRPLGIRGIDWDQNPQGINLGMIGLRLRTEDLARFGQLMLQHGKWNKTQLIPEEWVNEATSFKIESSDPSNRRPKELNDWAQGYCYQMWRGRNNTVRLDGMAGQFVILIPDKDAIVVLTANARNTQDELDLVHNYLIPAIKSEKPLPDNAESDELLRKKQLALSIKTSSQQLAKSEFESKISGKEFMFEDNDYKIQSLYFGFDHEICSYGVKREGHISVIKAGPGSWVTTNSALLSLLAPPRNIPTRSIDANYMVPQSSVKAGAFYSWTDNNTMEITARYIEENLGAQTIVCRFSEINGTVRVAVSMRAPAFPAGISGRGGSPLQLRGTMVNIR